MQIKPGFVLKEIAGSYFAIPVDTAYAQDESMMSLNKTGAFLWEKLESRCDAAELAAALMEEYHIDRGLADEAVGEFLEAMRKEGLLEDA